MVKNMDWTPKKFADLGFAPKKFADLGFVE
jgi:hypothetical protein